MTVDDIEVLERIYARWADGNFWSFESFDEEVRARWATEVPDIGSSEGIDGLAQLLRDWLAAWQVCRIEAEEFHDAGGESLPDEPEVLPEVPDAPPTEDSADGDSK
jgi:hypothetical protein